MAKKIAVAVIHGMGSQGHEKPKADELYFSQDLFWGVRHQLGEDLFRRVGWREIFWADILQTRQQDYLDDITEFGTKWPKSREFVMHRLADAASYRRVHYPADPDRGQAPLRTDTYHRVHARVARTLRRLEALTGPQTPLIVLAHSLGGHVMSNYMYDMEHGQAVYPAQSGFQAFQTLSSFVTFGCNLPVFSFNVPSQNIAPIGYPGKQIAANDRARPWWYNVNSSTDILGMPLGPSAPAYEAMSRNGMLCDLPMDVGGPLVKRTPVSHNAYWGDEKFHGLVAQRIRQAFDSKVVPETQS